MVDELCGKRKLLMLRRCHTHESLPLIIIFQKDRDLDLSVLRFPRRTDEPNQTERKKS